MTRKGLDGEEVGNWCWLVAKKKNHMDPALKDSGFSFYAAFTGKADWIYR